MTEKTRKNKYVRILMLIRRYVMFFLMMAFIISCCMMLFVTELTQSMQLELTAESIKKASTLTFVNVVFLSIMCTAIDVIRRKIMVERPVKHIVQAAQKIMEGDFSTRISPVKNIDDMSGFDIIAEYFNKMTEELSGIETLRTDFIANVSHELKTPLSVIQNYGTMLQQPGLSETSRIEYAKAVTEASRRLADLITNILKLNKLENQQIFPATNEYDLGEQLCECLLNFENAWEKKELELEVDIEENVMVSADSELLSLVWNNLFSNAIKFSERKGKIFLSLKSEGEFAIVSVSDTGCGISPDVGKHMFEKFYQGDTSHSRQGNGLGLALVKRVIDITGGDISVASEIGKGSTFTVKLRTIRKI